MNYYVVSPNVYNDGDNYAQKMFSKGIAAVGWDTDRQKGQQFDSITQGDCIIVAQRVDWQWTYYYMGIVLGNEDKPSYGTLSKRLSPIISLDGIDLNFEDWTANGSNQVPSPQRIDINSNINIIENIKKIFNMQKYTDLLKSNHNLILTGAPGTGKTYLAKQIAQQMIFGEIKDDMTQDEKRQFNEQCGFVQFHPSYDYTDFVEGLRPQDDNNNVGFGREDGVFKEFCNRALKCYGGVSQLPNFDDIYDSFIEDILNDPSFELETEKQKRPFKIEVNRNKNLNVIPQTNINRTYKPPIKKEVLRDYLESGRIVDWKSYVPIIGEYIRKNYLNEENQSKRVDNNAKFVFIIDEINRGEISKIFGELFFSIDPGYRGKDGKVRTQYANMQVVANIFDQELNITNSNDYGHFFVPENVYIIGTMNDIDRSVESMDFAFRRRFAFKEIKAIDRVEMLYDSNNGIGKYADEAKERMNRLNMEIEKIEGLSTAYHIGPAYFLKLKNYNGDFQQLWENHLEGLLREYLRGMQNVDEKMKILKAAYDNESNSNN